MVEGAVPIGAIINIGSKIAEYFHIFEGVLTKTTKLQHQAFKSAIENLRYAYNCSAQNQIDYVKRAKDRFIDAIVVEDPKEQILALGGLSFCQYLLGESNNADYSLQRISEVEMNISQAATGLIAEAINDSLFGRLCDIDIDTDANVFLTLQEVIPKRLKKMMTDNTFKPLCN